MSLYILKRTLISIVTLWVVVTITFGLAHAIPGGPFDREKKIPEEIKKAIEAKYHLDKPLAWQYAFWLGNLVRFDLGVSTQYRDRSINDIIGQTFPVSAQLGFVSVLLAIAIGIPLGVVAALKQGKAADSIAMIFATIGITVPSFVIATLLLYFFAFQWQIFPSFSWGSAAHFVLPSIALAFGPVATISRLTRSSLLDVIRQDYIRTARAKGLSEGVVIYKHALKNAILPVLTFLGPLIAGIFTGSFVIERIFTIPGLGKMFVDTISNRDYTAILGITVFYGAFLIACNFLVDLGYVFVDPRIKLEG